MHLLEIKISKSKFGGLTNTLPFENSTIPAFFFSSLVEIEEVDAADIDDNSPQLKIY